MTFICCKLTLRNPKNYSYSSQSPLLAVKNIGMFTYYTCVYKANLKNLYLEKLGLSPCLGLTQTKLWETLQFLLEIPQSGVYR